MAIRILIVDPDIELTIRVKRALEEDKQAGYSVTPLASGLSAIEAAQRQAFDVAILDFEIHNMDLPTLIAGLRKSQPELYILACPRTSDQVAQLPSLDIQGTITKPYFARQLIPVIRESVRARNSFTRAGANMVSAAKPPTIPETSIQPDDTFHRKLRESNAEDTGRLKSRETFQNALDKFRSDNVDVPNSATVREMMTGQTQPLKTTETKPTPSTTPTEATSPPVEPTLLETVNLTGLSLSSEPSVNEADTPTFATTTLEASTDEKVPLEALLQNAMHQIEVMKHELPTESQPEEKFPETSDEVRFKADQVTQFLIATGPIARIESLEQQAASTSVENINLVFEDTGYSEEHTPSIPMEVTAARSEQTPPMAGDSVVENQLIAVDKDPLAEVALRLTQLNVNSSAVATLISHDNTLVASAGNISEGFFPHILSIINKRWQQASQDAVDGHRTTLLQHIDVVGLGGFLLFTAATVDAMLLSMLFAPEANIGTIRKEAKNLLTALASVPDSPVVPVVSASPTTEVEAATTLPSRPTDIKPPEVLQSAVATSVVDEPLAAHAFLWLPNKAPLPSNILQLLDGWLKLAAQAHGWKLDSVDAQAGHIIVYASAPVSITATETVEGLMRNSADFAAAAGIDHIWDVGYYIVSPARELSAQEIADFVEFQHN